LQYQEQHSVSIFEGQLWPLLLHEAHTPFSQVPEAQYESDAQASPFGSSEHNPFTQ